ncbi:MAG: LysR family transcriptional regulator [Cyanobacteria bacterium P01_E01_bin.6]
MNLKTFSSFITLAEELHFGRAAHLCDISQPAMSRLLSELEAELGVKLLNRTSRDVSLTTAGKGFLASARKAVAYADMAIRAAKANTVDGIDSLTVGMMIGAAQPFVGRLLAQFKATHPETRVSLTQTDERSIGSALANGDIDVAIAWDGSLPAGLQHRHLGSIPMSILVPCDHRLAAKKTVQMEDTAGEPIILPSRDRQPIIYNTYLRHTSELGFEPLIVIDVSTTSDLLAMVAGGMGIGNAPTVPGLAYPDVCILQQTPLFELNYELAWTNQTPAVACLLEILN